MFGAVIDVTAAVVVTALVMLVPGALLLVATGADRLLAPMLRPAAAVLGTILLSSLALFVTLAGKFSLDVYALLLLAMSGAAGVLALKRRRPLVGERSKWHTRIRLALPYMPPALVLSALSFIDSPHVRSDTYWHVALARKLADLDVLASSSIAFEAGAKGNANYPLPSWHALIALADAAPRVDLWSATWFLTMWMAPVAMLAFGSLAATFLADRRAALVGCWGFVAVVVIGYGPWFFATRYLSYAGQIAIYLALPVIIALLISAQGERGRRRAALLVLAGVTTAEMGVLHGNYVLYPVLFAAGATVLLALGRRNGWPSAGLGLLTVGVTGMLALGAQLPWITNDENFLRGSGDPTGEPTAFIRHRDAFTGTEESHHVVLGTLATQPMLALGALAIPVVLLLLWRRRGPWYLAGGSLALVIFARTPFFIDLIDKLGSVTPATRFDRVYPAAVGAVAIAVGLGWLLERARSRAGGRVAGALVCSAGLAAIAVAAAWQDTIRDTKRIVVTPFVEARWVGGLSPNDVPHVAVVAASVATMAVTIYLGVRMRERTLLADDDVLQSPGSNRRHLLATLVMCAVVIGLTPTTIERLGKVWQPEAYQRSLRNDGTYSRIEVYPVASRQVVDRIPAKSVVLAGLNDTRRIASLTPVYSIDESVLRDLQANPPEPGKEAADRLGELVTTWKVAYIASNGFDTSFKPLIEAAAADPEQYQAVAATGYLRVYRVRAR